MRRWEHHRTRSKVALLLLINLLTLLGGKYTALITIVKLELFGEAIASTKTPKKKPAKSHLRRAQREFSSSPPATGQSTKLGQRGARAHVVRRGETLSQIARRYGLSVKTLQAANQLQDASHLLTGHRLHIPRDARAVPSEPERSTRANDRSRLLDVQRPLERHTHPPTKGRRGFIWPVAGALTSPFGERDHVMGGGGARFHAGVDLAVPVGTPVRAAQEGLVVFAGYNGAYGKVVKLDHLNGYSTLYAHNSRIVVHVGQKVRVRQVICLSGNTGRSTGPHLHFEVHKDGWPVDPLPYLQ
jgi:murein DD-endopeptidase MepM/ murein hydrolase activator NlpD